jgi:protein-L-isoaspartate(D-aspartate) O-methyltransferase
MRSMLRIRSVFAALGLGVLSAGCDASSTAGGASMQSGAPLDPTDAPRRIMVSRQLESRGISDPRVLDAMRRVPRHRFVPAGREDEAYDDAPLSIGFGQTISQPYVVAYMTEMLRVEPQHRVLEIGTGSGYQAAVLAELAGEVYSVEIVPELGKEAGERLAALGYTNVHVRVGDGYLGWPEVAPFDRVMVTAAPDHVPQPLVDQLGPGGRLVLPVGRQDQWIRILTKTAAGVVEETTIPVRFVPLVRQPGAGQ